MRQLAARRIEWRSPKLHKQRKPVAVQVLGINDFHGQLSVGRRVANRPVGGAAVLAAYLSAARQAFKGDTFIVHAGDHVGASPPASALLQDEPSIQFLNLLANKHCKRRNTSEPQCNLVGTLGNHEFDEGVDELLRLITGGNHANGPFLESPYRGASFPYVSANVVDVDCGEPILPPYVIKQAGGVKVAFIGAVLKQTPTIVTPTGVAGVHFLDEAEAINSYIPELRKKKVEAIVVVIHQGGSQPSYAGATNPNAGALVGADILNIVSKLDSAVDVVVSGHAHAFTNAIVNNAKGQPILVTQAFSGGTAYDAIELGIDPVTRDVVQKSASIVTTYGDEGAGLVPDAQVAALVLSAESAVAPLVDQIIGESSAAIAQAANGAGESAIGNLIADAQRAATGSDFAFMNPGGIRAGLPAGQITWGALFTVQPFGNSLVRMDLTGAQIYAVLEQQWQGQPFERIMQISGLTYTWDAALPIGSRVVEARKDGAPIDLGATYSVTANSFIAAGGDNFSVFAQGGNRVGGAVDLDALVDYIEALAQPFGAAIEGRIQRLN